MYPDLKSILDSTEDARQSFKVTSKEHFCEQCRSINFFKLFFTRNPNYNSAMWNRDNKPPRHDLGSVAEVQLKMGSCQFCSWIMNRLQDTPRSSKLLANFRVELWTSPYFLAQFKDDDNGQNNTPLYFRKLDLNIRNPRDLSNSLPEIDMKSFQVCDSSPPTAAGRIPHWL